MNRLSLAYCYRNKYIARSIHHNDRSMRSTHRTLIFALAAKGLKSFSFDASMPVGNLCFCSVVGDRSYLYPQFGMRTVNLVPNNF